MSFVSKLKILTSEWYYRKSEIDDALSSKVDSYELASVAFSGSYNDLTNKPTIPVSMDIIETVAQLPTASGNTMNKFYLVPSDDEETNDIYDIYVTVETVDNNVSNYDWERVDNAKIDLEGSIETILEDTIESEDRTLNFHIYNKDRYDNDNTDEPAQSVTVSLNGKSSITGSAGGCTIRGVSDGEYQVKLEKNGYYDVYDVTIDKDHLDFKFYFYYGTTTQ